MRRPTSLTEIVLSDPELEASIKTGLDAVEERLREAVRAADPLVNEAAAHLLDAGGKRFRPLLVLAAAQFGDPELPAVLESAVVVELTHLATLYHDDVMDEADVRRGAPSANARWSNSVAILTGDYLFARASDVVADLGPEAVRIQSRTFSRLVTGQIRDCRPAARRRPGRALPGRTSRQDWLADRHLRAVRGDVLRRFG